MKTVVRIDIVSDVMCPWCVIGASALQQALMALDDRLSADIHWQPFELNPGMAAEGQNLREHLMEKYGISVADSVANRERIMELGSQLGFTFRFTDEQRMYNTFHAHQLLHWAAPQGAQTALQMALFTAHFRDGRNVGDDAELVAIAAETGLDAAEAAAVLADQRFAADVRAQQQYWQEAGIHAVPAVILQQKYLLSGGQPPEAYLQALTQVLQEAQDGDDD